MCDSFLRPPSSKPVRQPSQQIRICSPIAFQNGQKKAEIAMLMMQMPSAKTSRQMRAPNAKSKKTPCRPGMT
jgi:hypothetical protein